MKDFSGFGLSPALTQSLVRMNYTTPTPIQAQAIPFALDGHDILGTAQTGTGKTAAFAIPLIEKLLSEPRGSALVLTPTRELGKQIMDIMHQLLGPKSPIKTAFIIGGEPMGKQYNQLQAGPRLIVGTPGRINDHLERGSMALHDTHFLVLDETDRMLDMGFAVQLERIFKFMPAKRQTLMFSATLPKNILALAQDYMNAPQRVSVGQTNVVAQNIKQDVIRIEQEQKYEELLCQLHEREGSVIVFIKTKYGADRMSKNLRRDGFTSEALHGDLRQNKRDKVMQNFRQKNFRVLIATDIAARGLDVPHIEHVINYDLPQVAEDFIHRMGRTARAGAQGSAVSFVSNQDGRKWHAIERLLNPQAKNTHEDGKKKQGVSRRKFKKSGEKNSAPAHSGMKKTSSDKDNAGKPFQGKKKAVANKGKSGQPFQGKKQYAGKKSVSKKGGFKRPNKKAA
jgi:superfamily II DNA/RNA helicase